MACRFIMSSESLYPCVCTQIIIVTTFWRNTFYFASLRLYSVFYIPSYSSIACNTIVLCCQRLKRHETKKKRKKKTIRMLSIIGPISRRAHFSMWHVNCGNERRYLNCGSCNTAKDNDALLNAYASPECAHLSRNIIDFVVRISFIQANEIISTFNSYL